MKRSRRYGFKNTLQGSGLLLTAAFLYGLYGVYSRFIGEDFGSFFTIGVRATIMSILLIVYVFLSHKWKAINKKDIKWFGAMILPGIVAIVSVFIAFNHLPIGTVYFTLYASSTVFAYLIGKLFFEERIDKIKIISLLTCLIGLLVIFRETMRKGEIFYLFLAIVVGLGTAAWNIFSKKVTAKYSLSQVLTIDSLITVVVALPLAIILSEPISLPSLTTPWLVVALFALTAVTTSLLTIGGFKLVEAQKGSLVMLSEPIFGALFGYLFFEETPSSSFALGALLIMVGMTLPILNENKR